MRILRAVGLLAVFAGLAAWYGPWRRPDLWKEGPVQRVQGWRQANRCLDYVAPPDCLVGEIGPPGSRDWFAPDSGGDGRGAFVEGAVAGFFTRTRTPDCLTDLLGPRRGRGGPMMSRAAVLVHRMKPPGSPSQIVVAYHLPVLNDSAPREPRGRVEGSDHTTRNAWPVPYRQYSGAMFPWVAPGRVLRLCAGQPDPKDATHFTYAYALDGQGGTVDAWLRNDDRLHWAVRDGPALEPPTLADAADLPPPGSLAVAEFRRNTARVTWTPSAGAAGYEVAFTPVDTTRRAWPGGTNVDAGETEASVRGLVPDMPYTFRVRAWRGNTHSEWAIVTATTPPPPRLGATTAPSPR